MYQILTNLSYVIVPGITLLLTLSMSLLYLFQNKILYLPSIGDIKKSPKDNPIRFQNPSGYNMPYEDVQIKTKDEITLRGWFIFQKNQKETAKTIVFFHENAGNIGLRNYFLHQYYTMVQCNILIIAYRGYSDSDGEPNEDGISNFQKLKEIDSLAILDYIFQRNDIDKNNIFIHGRSLGGAVGIYGLSQQKDQRIKGLILENTFTSISDMVDKVFPFLKLFKKLIQRNYWNSLSIIQQIQQPILFIMADKDEIVPYIQMLKLYDFAKKSLQKEKFVIINGTHNTSWMNDQAQYFGKIKQFLNQFI